MFSIKLPMRKYFTLLYVTFSVMSFAQFTDNVFEQQQSTSGQQQSSTMNSATQAEANPNSFAPEGESQPSAAVGVPGPGDHEEAPGNPGEPVPINDYIPYLVIAGLFLMIYYQTKNKKINI